MLFGSVGDKWNRIREEASLIFGVSSGLRIATRVLFPCVK
ncbi:unnamed protein product [Arabidopsis halleri]